VSPTPITSPSPQPTATPTPTRQLPRTAITGTLPEKTDDGLLDKRGIAVQVGCGKLQCNVTVTAQLLVPRHAALKLPTTKTSLKAGAKPKSVRLATSAKQRARIRKLVGGAAKARVRITIKATGADGRTVTTTNTIQVSLTRD
jgi:hypothetical protein